MKKFPRAILAAFAFQVLSQSVSPAATPQTADWRRYVIAHPDVVYPEVVKRTGMEGLGVFLLAIDRKDGSVTEVKVLKSTGRRKLDAIYVMNFFQWRFQPGTIGWARIPRGVHVTGRANIYHGAQ
jgi:TonB family protein